MATDAKQLLKLIHQLPITETIRVINVCGGHERSISQAGLRSILPKNIELIPGPGCPVCICPEEDIYHAIQIALNEEVILLAFGDLFKVPINSPINGVKTLDQAKARGAEIFPIASPIDAVNVAKKNPERTVVFFVAGFETTCAPVAAMLSEDIPKNLLLLMSGRLTWPAVKLLLDSDKPNFDALIAPGHVATIMGDEQWRFVSNEHHIPTAVAGFTSESLLRGLYSVLRQHLEKNIFLDNCYTEVVQTHGNLKAKKLLANVFSIVDASWRGIGIIPNSGYELTDQLSAHNARHHFPEYENQARKNAGKMPPGCDCAKVILGKIKPNECALYGHSCSPKSPVGPCMVSDEGACKIWWDSGISVN